MPRILLLITDLQIGGTPTVVRELAIRLTAAGGAEVEVACLSSWGPVADQLQQAGIVVTALGAGGVADFPAVVWRLSRLIVSRQIDLVFSFLLHANVVAAATSPISRRVRWLQSIQTTQPTPKWHWQLQSLAQHVAQRIVVPSPSVARVAREWAGVPQEKIVVISNAVDLKQFAREERHVRSECWRVGFIGRLDPIKRVPDLVEAMALLEPTIHLDIFGQGSASDNIQDAIRRLHLQPRVTMHGSIIRPQDALTKIDVLVLPSQSEGFGLVLIEAMAAGVPVVATDVAGIRDVVRHRQSGLLVPVASPAALAQAIQSVFTDNPLRQKVIHNATAEVCRRFSWEIILPQYQKLLLQSDE